MRFYIVLYIILSSLFLSAQTPILVIPKGHTGIITSSACSQDGRFILTGARDLSAKLWDNKGNEMISYSSPSEIQSVAISNNSEYILIGSTDNKAQLFKITGEKIKDLPLHKNFINSVAFAPGNNLMATASDDNSAKVYDINGNIQGSYLHKKSVKSVCFDSKGKRILTASSDKTAVLWNFDGTKQSFIGHTAGLNQAKISKDGNYILSCSDDKTAILWNNKGKIKHKIKHFDKVTAIDIDQDNSIIISGSYNGEIKIWTTLGKILKEKDTKEWGISSITILPDRKSFIVTSADYIRQYDLNLNIIRKYEAKAKSVTAICFANEGKAILQGDQFGAIKEWDAFQNNFKSYQMHNGMISSIAISPDNLHWASSSEDKNAIVTSLNGTVENRFTLDSKTTSVSFSPEGKMFLIGTYNNSSAIKSLDKAINKTIKQAGQHIIAAAYTPNGKYIVTASEENNVSIFSDEGNPVKTFSTQSSIKSLAISSDSKSIITGCFNGLTQVWSLENGSLNHSIGRPLGDEVISVAVSKNNELIASGYNSGALRLVNIITNNEILIKGHTTKVNSISFTPDNKLLASGSSDGTIKIWDCGTGKEIADLIALDKSDWVVTTPEGLFDASANAMVKLKYRVGLEMIDLDQLKERYYEPGLLSTIFKINNNEMRDVTAFNSVPLYPEINATIIDDELSVKLKPRGGELGKLSIFINNKEVIEDANPDRKTEINKIRLNQFDSCLINGSNKVIIRAYNKDAWLKSAPYEINYKLHNSRGEESPTTTTNNTSPFKKKVRSLYAIIIGTSDYSGDKLDLVYPDKDATSFASAIQQVGSRLFGERVYIHVLTTTPTGNQQKSTRKNIEKTFNDIQQKINSEDVFIVYFAGHGVNYGEAEKSQFYYLTTDIKSDNLQEKEIRDAYTISSEDLTKWLKTNHSQRQVVIMDACHSGDLAKSLGTGNARALNPTQIKAFERMKDRTGIFIITGSANDKVSYESSEYGQGLLTYSLLEGMSREAKKNVDKLVDVSSLFNYSCDRVVELANHIDKIQKPVFGAPLGAASFDIGISDDQVNIEIKQAKPVFIQSSFQNNEGWDNLELTGEMKKYLSDISKDSDSPIAYFDVDYTPNSFKMSGNYSVSGDKINITVNIIKNKQLVTTLLHEGNKNNLKEFVSSLFTKVKEKVK